MQEKVIKVLRILLPIIFIAFVGLIIVSWRRGGVRKGKEDTNPVAITRPEKPQSELREFDETQSIAGRIASHIHAKRVVSYTSNWNTLEDVELTIYRPNNLIYKLVCPQAQVNTKTKEADAKGGVRVTSGDGIEITTAEIHFDGDRLTNHIPMQFRIDRWSGTAGALDLDVQGEILRLYEKVDATMAPAQPGESALNLKGQEGVWRRKEGDVTVTQNVVMTRLADNVSSDKMLARFTPDRKQIVGLEGEGHVVMNMSAPPPTEPGGAPSEDLGGAKHLYCDRFNSELGPDGKINAMNAIGDPGTAHAVIDGPPGRDMVARSFRVGLIDKVVTDIKAESQVVLHETGEIPREITTDHLTVLFDRASHRAATALLEGSVRYKDPKNQAQAVRANYDITGDRVVLTAEPGFDPTVVSDGQTVKARIIEFSPKSGTAKATGDVIAQLVSKQNGGASADGTTMFPANKPVFVNADGMTSRQATKTAVFTGNVRAWQDTNTLFANEMQVQGAGDQIIARGNARTVLYNVNTTDKKVSTTPMRSRSDQLLAWKNERRIELIGGVKIEDEQRTMTGEHATIYFDANRKIERTDAEKNVVLVDGSTGRKGTGDKATYNVAKRMVYMMGTATVPATATSPNGMMKGEKIAFDLARNKVDVVSPNTPTEGVYRPDAKP